MSDATQKVDGATSREGRYFRKAIFFLDHDDGGYTNSYEIFDGDKPTGILQSSSGHSRMPAGHRISIEFRNVKYNTLREAVTAYEAALEADATPKHEGGQT